MARLKYGLFGVRKSGIESPEKIAHGVRPAPGFGLFKQQCAVLGTGWREAGDLGGAHPERALVPRSEAHIDGAIGNLHSGHAVAHCAVSSATM